MRKFKFRVWDKEEKRFWYFDLQEVLEKQMAYKGSWDLKILKGEKTQYTGLKDKNGKEIYEGDIVEFYWGEIWDGKLIKFIIEYDDKQGTYLQVPCEKSSDVWSIIIGNSDSNNVEIVGSIFEKQE